MQKLSIRIVFLLFVVSISYAAFLQAQGTAPTLRKLTIEPASRGASITPEDYGVQDVIYTVIPATDFRPFDSGTGYTTGGGEASIFRTGGGSAYFSHQIQLPPGAILIDITAYVSDTSVSADIGVFLDVSFVDTGTGLNPGGGFFVSGSTSGTPGKTAIVVPYNNTLPASNGSQENAWTVVITLNATDGTNSFSAVRLKWRRQVSPAPLTARFTDVPTTHVFFQYIEALAASGITGGCSLSPPQYCPDAPLTRGQMAVFLARALGLHWTP